ncbi:20361_t:CDS:10 [Funneliformis geosporum]|uniref:Glutamyl-tRNA(Gln) amidotransferase subunit A, mitochondrial n=1 Tax=Funneliformis geosporum TaxID=1117311 RepID=A0A9W4SLP6_9GLOM|nr:20361_t:CDS:10 [Funneliformis geosporum]CAI2174027.1 12702_t:CDS:10 [Funneliformis geosporum]
MSMSRTITEAANLLRQKKISTAALVKECLSRISKHDSKVNAFIEVQNEKEIFNKALEVDDRFAKGSFIGSLDGIPIAYKDLFCTSTLPTTCGSMMLKNFKSPFNASVVNFLEESGAIMIGKTNMDEFGMGSASVFSIFGPVYNPQSILFAENHLEKDNNKNIKERRIAGGSSGGSAAAVAAGMCFAALGSDTGGSVRLPASYCGVVGFKPSYGRCSRWGLVAYANSLDTVGTLTRTVNDAKLIYDVISKYDANDSTSMSPKVRSINSSIPSFFKSDSNTDDLRGLRVGVPKASITEYYVSELNDSIIDLWKKGIYYLRSQGASIVPVSCPNTRYALSAYYVLALSEASSNLSRYDGVRYVPNENDNLLYADTREGFGKEVKRRIMLGTYALTAGSYGNYFLQAQKIRRMIQKDFDRVFKRPNPLHFIKKGTSSIDDDGVDILLTPVAISTAPKIEDCLETNVSVDNNSSNFVNAYVNDVLTVPASLAGIPSISVPYGVSSIDGYPIGLQLMTQYGDEDTLLEVAKVLEKGAN